MRKSLITFALILIASASIAQQKSMNEYINELMSKMTLKEKIGQLNLMVAGDITT